MDFKARVIKPLPNSRLQVELVDGRSVVFDLSPHLNLPGFSALRDASYFNKVQLLYGAATWPDGEDITPETLAAELKIIVSA